jgi:hypothetical protein
MISPSIAFKWAAIDVAISIASFIYIKLFVGVPRIIWRA